LTLSRAELWLAGNDSIRMTRILGSDSAAAFGAWSPLIQTVSLAAKPASRKSLQMQSHAQKSELLTVAELAREWKQNPATIYRKIQTGEIPAIRLGNGTSALRIPRAELEAQILSPSGPKAA
jgi:excisionase family DNA binding protein